MIEWFTPANWYAFSAALAGGLWGVTMQHDFASLTMRAKTWRFFLSVIAAIFTGPYILHRFLGQAHPSASAFVMFCASTLALATIPLLAKKFMEWLTGVRITFDGREGK